MQNLTSLDLETQAIEAMTAAGLTVHALQVNTTDFQRVPTVDHPRSENGYYIFSTFTTPKGGEWLVGSYGNWATDGEQFHTFKANTSATTRATPKEREALARVFSEHRKQHNRERENKAQRAAKSVENILKGCTPLDVGTPQWRYLDGRYLWSNNLSYDSLSAHQSLYHPKTGQHHPAIIARVYDEAGELVCLHRTWLTPEGEKLKGVEPRMLTPLITTSAGKARFVPLASLSMSDQGALGVAEGIEDALAVMRLSRLPCWSVINAGNMIKFTPPQEVTNIIYFADNDAAGLRAAQKGMTEAQAQRPTLKAVILPPPTEVYEGFGAIKDWNDYLITASEAYGLEVL